MQQADAAPVPAAPARRDRYTPHLSNEDASIIDNAIRSAGERRGLRAATVGGYVTVLRGLGDDLARNGQSISALDHNSLVAHANKFGNRKIITGLRYLREYLEPGGTSGRSQRGRQRSIPAEDQALIEGAARSSRRPAAAVVIYSGSLRIFSEALNREGHAIARLDHESRIKRAKELRPNDTTLGPALKMIDEFQRAERASGASSSWHLGRYPEDAALIDGALDQALKNLEPRKSAQERAARLHTLGAWLKENGRESMAGRLNRSNKEEFTLRDDVLAFKLTEGRLYDLDLAHLRNYLKLVEANHALGPEAREQPALPSGLGAGRPSPSQALPATPATPSEGAWALLRKEMQEPASPSTARARSDTYAGLEPFVDLNAPTPSELRDDAHFAPAHLAGARSNTYAGLDSFVDLNAPTPSELRDDAQSPPVLGPAGFVVGASGSLVELEDIGPLVGENWQHGSRPVPDFLLDALDNIGVLPTQFSGPRQVSINGETYSITLRTRGRRDAQFIHHPRPSPVPDARTGTSVTGASSAGRSGRVLGATDWLSNEHIQRDYELLTQELQESNPDLAARTQFVNPLIAQMVRSDALAAQALNWIGHTDDFLFLPVNDAGAEIERRGSHWSLLLIDRSDRSRPVAHYYDSLMVDDGYGSQVGYNDRPAAELARRLGANPQRAAMRQQSNTYDCGVFVVDGTRELVRRLATGQPDLLNLKNLRVSRLALQNRLRS
ncbi:Ulp1 family isopeptidase [Bradyrhizobium sp. Leo121]|uniref:Ulp1 family isopeptidase n=1 Tax=Bradyrhizobium sp. Leo121 TaxID=1571195 RepID=UPI001FE08931|nr:Ulp1 family isopeptidase [Bradyrhizobium sp. Leo121]